MSLRYEQYRALRMTRQLLGDLLTPGCYPKTRRELRKRVSDCLRHFPYLREDGEPMFSNDKTMLKRRR
jgi:hypothetical protein